MWTTALRRAEVYNLNESVCISSSHPLRKGSLSGHRCCPAFKGRYPNRRCSRSGKAAAGSMVRHGFYTTSRGKRRRYRCRICGKTFCSNTGTPYHRLQHRRATFDEVAAFSVEGLNQSAIARVNRIAWNTVHRWLEKAADCCRRFNDRKINGLSVVELQADEIKTIVGGKEQPIWVFAVIDVWSRLWPSTVVGKRSDQNTLALFRNVSCRMNLKQPSEEKRQK